MKSSELTFLNLRYEDIPHGIKNLLSNSDQSNRSSHIEMTSDSIRCQRSHPLGTETRAYYCMDDERILNRSMGGEIYDLIERFEGKDFNCIGHLPTSQEPVGTWYGYPHDGGIADAVGTRWWAYQRCMVSGYQTAWWKVERLVIIENNLDERANQKKIDIEQKNPVPIIGVGDYYRLLCVECTATQIQIKKNYRYLVKRFHPDSSSDEREKGLELMKSINEAYDVLSDPKARSRYDRTLK